MKRTDKIDVSLYNDALKRQMKQNEQPEGKSTHIQSTKLKSKSEEHIVNRLIKQLINSYALLN